MRLLASAVMRGRSQAVMLATILAVLSWILPPVSVLSSAVVALVTMRRGWLEGLLIMALGGLACSVLAWLTLGNAVIAVGVIILMWLPVWLLAILLRAMRSLDVAVQGALLLGVVLILAQFMRSGDPAADWRLILEPFVESLVTSELIEETYQAELIDAMSRWMPGLVAAGFFIQSVVSIFLARWWQAILYNPGGFRQEFHRLRMHKGVALVTLGVVAGSLLTSGDAVTWLDFLLTLLTTGWMVQGLALIHGLVARFKANAGWLVGTYVLLMFAPSYMIGLLAAVGFADTWFDFRARSGPGQGPRVVR